MKKYLLKTKDKKIYMLKDKEILDFYNTMIETNPEYNFSYLNSNIKNLKVSPIRFKLFEKKKLDVVAYYNCKKNVIKYIKKYKKKSLPHELMHMASTVKKEDGSIYSGFSQSTRVGNFLLVGRRFNEGYTQLLAERFFSDSANKAYQVEKLIAAQLEKIIGKKEMEQMYFDADLAGILGKLSLYADEKDILNFICLIDYFENIYNRFKLINNFEYIKEIYIFIIDFLGSIMKQKLENENYSKKEINETLKEYLDTFLFNLNIKGEKKQYKIVNEEIINEIYNKYCIEIKDEKHI